jgi:hypothetical protein
MSTTKEARHTPGPWRWGGAGRKGTFAERSHVVDMGNPPSAPFAVCYGDRSIEENRANAEFIVKACNSHASLLAALKAARDAVRNSDALYSLPDALMEQIEAAIRDAGGER